MESHLQLILKFNEKILEQNEQIIELLKKIGALIVYEHNENYGEIDFEKTLNNCLKK